MANKLMPLNKKAEAISGVTIFFIAAIVILGAYLISPGFKATVDNIFHPSASPDTSDDTNQPLGNEATKDCPSSGTTVLTLNVGDALASSPTNIDAEYYIFGDNKLFKEGTTGTDGTVDISLTCGMDFKVLLVNTSTGTNGAYSKVFDYSARRATDSISKNLNTVGTIKILGIENPSDPSRNSNVSIVGGQAVNFDLKFAVNSTEDAVDRPTVMCQANVSSIKDVSINSFSDGVKPVKVTSNPNRISATSGYQYFAYEYPQTLTQAQGVRTASGSVTALGTITPVTNDKMTCLIVDHAMWKKASYKSAGSVDEGFTIGMENTESNSDVGAADSAPNYLYWGNTGGY